MANKTTTAAFPGGGEFDGVVTLLTRKQNGVSYEAWAKRERLDAEEFLWSLNLHPDTPAFRPGRALLRGPDGRDYKVKSAKKTRSVAFPWMTLIQLHTERQPRKQRDKTRKQPKEQSEG